MHMNLPPGWGPPISSSRMPARPVTYSIFMTSKALRVFEELPARLVAAHRTFDPSVPATFIRVLTHLLDNYGRAFHVGGTNANDMNFRYMRIVVEIPVESQSGLAVQRKQELMRMIVDAMRIYEGKKKASETELDVVIREIRGEDEMWVRGDV